MWYVLGVYVCWVMLLSIALFAGYGWDKWQARRQGWRVSERTLHRLAFAGGWPGGWLAQRVFQHKTRKVPFQRIFWLAPVLHLVVISLLCYLSA